MATIREKAAQWYAQLHAARMGPDDAFERLWQAFETWLGEDPRHRAAYLTFERSVTFLIAQPPLQ